jgi:hypothetical protein
MHLGLGAALENLALAAHAWGFSAIIDPVEGRLVLSPDNSPVAVARLSLRPIPPAHGPLFDAIPHRHTNPGKRCVGL